MAEKVLGRYRKKDEPCVWVKGWRAEYRKQVTKTGADPGEGSANQGEVRSEEVNLVALRKNIPLTKVCAKLVLWLMESFHWKLMLCIAM